MIRTLFVLALLATIPAHASAPMKCEVFAQQAAAKWAEMSILEFNDSMAIIWSCKMKKNPRHEEFQFGDGSGFVGVSVKLVRGRCTLAGEIYGGQDDQDNDPEYNENFCL